MQHSNTNVNDRRRLLVLASAAGAGAVLGCAAPRPAAREAEGAEDVSPGEDLMREHGVLRRVLFVYGEGGRRIDAGEPVPGDVIVSGTGLIRRFIEDYHEKLEETELFPRFERAGVQTRLVAILRDQHARGRVLTDEIRTLSASASTASDADRKRLAARLRDFERMYGPHAAREDTVLFPAFHELVGPALYAELGERFEDQEHDLLGADGFEQAVAEVAELERRLGIEDLAQFTYA